MLLLVCIEAWIISVLLIILFFMGANVNRDEEQSLKEEIEALNEHIEYKNKQEGIK